MSEIASPAASHKLINRIVEAFLKGNMSVVLIFTSLIAATNVHIFDDRWVDAGTGN